MYRRTQPGTLIVATTLGAFVLTAVIWIIADGLLVFASAEAVLLLLLVLFRSLTIEIDDDELRCFFGDGLIRRRHTPAPMDRRSSPRGVDLRASCVVGSPSPQGGAPREP